MKKILKNLLIAICIIIYFTILILAYTRMNIERLSNDIQVFAGTFLVLGLLALEKAYKKDSGKIAITGIELLVLSFHSVSIMHMVNVFKCDFNSYLIISSVIVTSYYVLKGIVVYTKDRKEYLKGLSDISEIVKEDEPVKKEAKKRNTKKENVKENVKKEKQNIKDTKKATDGEKDNKKTTQTKKKTTSKKASDKKMPSTNKKTQTKKDASTNKTEQANKTKKSEGKSEVKTQTEKKKANNIKKTDEIKTGEKTKTAKKKTTKSKKEVKEND